MKGQSKSVWHDTIRELHYAPQGKSFKLIKGTRKFNRALYGTNTGFRVEAGDLPEFAMYMPGMGGNLKFGIAIADRSKWITACDSVATLYTPGMMTYKISDSLLGKGMLSLTVIASAEKEGLLVKLEGNGLSGKEKIYWTYGGASGKKFHRDGDIGADPESVFYLQPEYCINNEFEIQKNYFTVHYGSESNKKQTGNNRKIYGTFPEGSTHIGSANAITDPIIAFKTSKDTVPVITGSVKTTKNTMYWAFTTDSVTYKSQEEIAFAFQKSVGQIQKISDRVILDTPDDYLNTLGGTLALAADAIWEDPAYLHGSVAWRMHLNAWRGAYVADPLGWHERAETHFTSYANSQVLQPVTGPVVPDPAKNFARQEEKIGNSMFSSGYISRRPNNNSVAHHYDMNSVFFNQMLRHYKWTGDTTFIKIMWPYIKRHINWEKRNFDSDDNALYDAYATIWASDALQYSGGSVTYASAYNYSANSMMAAIGDQLGLPGAAAFSNEASRIKKAIEKELWIPEQGIYAEYKDLLNHQNLHNAPGIWTIYHALDEGLPNDFQAYQLLRYVDNEIPHIPIQATGLKRNDLFLVSTSNWQPYTWSVNNVALAENLHMALAYWQGNRPEKAFQLWESSLIESMYLGASPGGFQQLSFYDAMRGELYRDFADPIGMAARSLVEGLFGITPDAITQTLTISPGFPSSWDHAAITIPDITVKYEKKEKLTSFYIKNNFLSALNLNLELNPERTEVEFIKVNEKYITSWKIEKDAVGKPKLVLSIPHEREYTINIKWKGDRFNHNDQNLKLFPGAVFTLPSENTSFLEVFDPQQVLAHFQLNHSKFEGKLRNVNGHKTFFLKVSQGNFSWWQPIDLEISPMLEILSTATDNEKNRIQVLNNVTEPLEATVVLNHKYRFKHDFPPGRSVLKLNDDQALSFGNNLLEVEINGHENQLYTFKTREDYNTDNQIFKSIHLDSYLNLNLEDIFNQEYLAPRPESPTLQLPLQGIGNWCYPLIQPKIDISGLKKKASLNEDTFYVEKIPFHFNSQSDKNVALTSLWNNFPDSLQIPLSGNASHIYLLMTGTTNPMQTRMVNGIIKVTYTDGSTEVLDLKNPENWWPIEQDYYIDDFAFTTGAEKPVRIRMASGELQTDQEYTYIKGYTEYAIEGGAATLLDLPLHPDKTLEHLTITPVANDVIIGLLSLTLLK
ncbi:glycogen debranching protein [Robertkochia solimangrovi]|nr:glycogen debranching protein [Robertkochia solimangrovi]